MCPARLPPLRLPPVTMENDMTEKLDQWKALVGKELKGRAPEALTWNTLEGIPVKPLYFSHAVPQP